MKLMLVRTKIHNYVGLSTLAIDRVQPSEEWLAFQSVPPLPTGKWATMYPLSGGAACMQEGRYEVLREATQADIDQCASSLPFNPASHTVKKLWKESQNG